MFKEGKLLKSFNGYVFYPATPDFSCKTPCVSIKKNGKTYSSNPRSSVYYECTKRYKGNYVYELYFGSTRRSNSKFLFLMVNDTVNRKCQFYIAPLEDNIINISEFCKYFCDYDFSFDELIKEY